jgi:hypothetical protein
MIGVKKNCQRISYPIYYKLGIHNMIIDPILHITPKLVAHEWKNDIFG